MNIANLITIPALVLAISGSITSQSQKPATRPGEETPGKGFRARGGLVNFTEGEVQCVGGGEANTRVRAGQKFANGDMVQIGNEGRVEILLNPGYYLRLSNNTRAVLVDLSPANLKIKLLSGTAIFEVSVTDSPSQRYVSTEIVYAPVTVITPRDEYAIVKGGVYRFNVNADAGSNVRVVKGLAVVAGSRVTDGMIASVLNGRVDLAPADKKVMDAFDNWSRDRSASLVQANKSLEKAAWYKKIKKDRAYLEVANGEEATQAKTRHTVSARNGSVAFVENGAVLNPGETAWQELKAEDSLISGARVRTTVENRAEIHPYPNFYLFLGSNTEIVYSEREGGHVSVAVVNGSVIVVSQPDSKTQEQDSLTLIAEKTEYEILVRGSYRLNVIEGKSEMLVYDGVARVSGNAIKAGKRFVRAGTAEAVLPLDKLALDGLVVWSNRRMLLSAPGFVRRWLGMAGGLWLLHESTGEYTFVPAIWDYNSPYGGSYPVKYANPRELYQRIIGPPFPPFGAPN
jgi:hypothetical protein